jgi:DegV family protein with EDD domain
MKIKITVDSTNDLSPQLVEKYSVRVVPLSVNLGDKTYRDMVDITPDDIYAHVDGGGDLPKTSAVNADEYRAIFEECLADNDAVIHINISGEMSACHQNARLAAEGLNVFPVDSRSLSTGSALLAIRAWEMAAEGMAASDIADALRSMVDKVDASFLAGHLDYLYKGGRCSAVAMLGANLLKLRPCIEVREGVMGVGKKYRGGFVRCLENYVKDRLTDAGDIDTRRVFITHSGVSEDVIEAVRRAVEGCMSFDEILVTRAGCTISSHCGSGTLGILYMHR